MKKYLSVLFVAFMLMMSLNLTTFAAQPEPEHPAPTRHDPANEASAGARSGGNLTYHNGPVMHTNTTYAIYWQPAGYNMSADYQSVINGFFQNVAADSGKTSNVYYSTAQYYDNANGNITYNSTFGGSYVDTSAFPAGGCSDSVTQTSICISDAQIQAEIQKVMTAKGWTGGMNKLYFVFTPSGVGSCYSSSSCAFSQYCAYHSHIGSGTGAILYANQPYVMTVSAACDTGVHPNGSDADGTISVVSHEHAEAITDAMGSAWYDRTGYENGDKCAWTFGTALGSTSSGQYNQVIGNGKYYLQREWSNATSSCVLTNK